MYFSQIKRVSSVIYSLKFNRSKAYKEWAKFKICHFLMLELKIKSSTSAQKSEIDY